MSQPARHDEPPVLRESHDAVAILTLNRPRAYNALDLALGDALLEALIACDEDPAIRAVLVIGSGAAFCAGGDIRQMKQAVDATGHAGVFLKTLTIRLHAIVSTIARMAKPVVTAVNGSAAGAGFSLALTGDAVLASEAASFVVAYPAIGLAPDGSISFTLPRLVGAKRAFDLICSGRAVGAAEALALGLVSRTLPADGFRDAAIAYTRTLAAGPTLAFAEAKKLLALSPTNGLETQMEFERRAIAACGRTSDFLEGIEAFLGKRAATFRGA
ncbi:MAG: enoyl-CoA hydratase/isomerase family protein [Alphaproteobacteria bacterium]|nr:enoyl-CoA hydratase/isomerase family protein [Alphaproteobacteria bacterium]